MLSFYIAWDLQAVSVLQGFPTGTLYAFLSETGHAVCLIIIRSVSKVYSKAFSANK